MSKTLNIKDIQDKINANTVLTNEEEQYIEKFMLVIIKLTFQFIFSKAKTDFLRFD